MQGLNPEYLRKIAQLRLMDDDFMCAAFKARPDAVREVLVPLMGKPDLEVREVIVQNEYKNLAGRSVRLDVFAVDSAGKQYDIEIQREDRGAGAHRARYHLGLMDSHSLKAGMGFEALPESWIIFITEQDHYGKGLPLYHVERVVQETGALFEDGEHILYVNGAYRGDDPIGRLMADFRATEADTMHSPILSAAVRSIKETEEGQRNMCRFVEEEVNKAFERGVEQGVKQGVEQGVEQGVKLGVEQGVKLGVEQGVKQGVEQGVKQGVKLGRAEGKEEATQKNLRA
ncbi:MAG: hypothetical protein ACSW8F_06395, partial [bacterium]